MTVTQTGQVPARPSAAVRLASKRGIILDVGSGKDKQPGAVGMDVRVWPGVDVVHDWNRFPWPFENESVLTIIASHVVEHVNPADGHFVDWMNECWRILKPDRQMGIVTPYGGSALYFADPTHCNPCNHMTWWYFDPEVKISQPIGGDLPLYRLYEPAPWRIGETNFRLHGLMEVILYKREDDPSYHDDGEIHWR